MPKIKNTSIRLKEYIREFGSVFSFSDNCELKEELFCKSCHKNFVPSRWGTWLTAVEYYREYYSEFCDIIRTLNPKESIHIRKLQELIDKYDCSSDLNFISKKFNNLVKVIKHLEANDILLIDSLALIESVYSDLRQSEETACKMAFERLNNILDKNYGFKQILDIINGKEISEMIVNLNSDEITNFKYAPITSCDVERTFSKYKQILSDRRENFTEENLRFYLIVNSNNCLIE